MKLAQPIDKRLRLVLIATALLLLLQGAQILIVAQRNLGDSTTNQGFTFAFACLFLIPTSLILTGTVLWLLRRERSDFKPLFLLGAVNVLLAVQLGWFAVHPCSWAAGLGLRLAGC